MEASQFLKGDLDDIIFNGRHKEFGAYLIRKKYNERLRLALIITIAIMALFISAPYVIDLLSPAPVIEEVVHKNTTNKLGPPPSIKKDVPPPPKIKMPEPPKVIKYIQPEVVEHPDKPMDLPKNDDVKKDNTDNTDHSGDNPIIDPNPHVDIIDDNTEPLDFNAVEKQPCFPGGYDAIGPWIQAHAVYPDQAVELNLYGKVYVTITVDENGKIISAEIAKGVHKLLNDAALKVVKSIPFSCGAEQNGHKVRVTLTAPVNFKIQN